MRHLFAIFLIMAAPHGASAQSTDRNYVKETLYLDRTAMPGMRVPPGQTVELDDACVQATDTIDYLLGGNLIMKNGRTNWYLFDGGYAETVPAETVLLEKPVPPDTWEENPSQEKWEKYENDLKKWEEDMKNCTRGESFCFYFYNKDHTGNNREVVDTGGNVSQVTSYYPYGMPFCDSEAGKGAAVQPYKYNGKELDLMHGLNTYDYWARQYFSALPVWDRMDKICESDPGVSPYSYCKGDPVNSHDPDGNDPVTGAVIGAGIEIGSQLIENYDTNQSFFSNLANNVNWVNVGIAAGEGL